MTDRALAFWACLAATALPGPSAAASPCGATDFLAMPLTPPAAAPGLDAVAAALTLAYPDLVVSPDGTAWAVGGGPWRPLGTVDAGPPEATVAAPEVADQFRWTYPLDLDPQARLAPWTDPGRPRNSELFAALWFEAEDAARASLVPVEAPAPAGARFMVTRKRGVDCQLRAALEALAAEGDPAVAAAFRAPGGGFNWRRIAGTSRLSAHSYGIAVDINPELGGYWRWSGAAEGAVGPWESRVPDAVIRQMERFGFIWGGKWHHYDGMHFEYRPELILHARLLGAA